ncbi:hypothetical protein PSTT_04154 [Puccinia striiformis]|uniref:Uncharacterized protein n=1 Tax=Puccinia striiformis TaxID=27350 RepID=A0A2S4VTL3_9BASI|nr:hypothetical protein PSTT_04154 [Puccinia striiformis]
MPPKTRTVLVKLVSTAGTGSSTQPRKSGRQSERLPG